MNSRFAFAPVAALALATGLVVTGCADADSSAQRRVFTLRQASPELTQVDANDAGDLGDELVFSAPLTREGRPFGAVLGVLSNVGSDRQGRIAIAEERLAAVVFDLPAGTISVLSLSYYDLGQREMTAGRPVVRAIVGGTGRYIGARGEVRTLRRPDGTYQHILTLLD
ncbi:MAG: hypothetical protein ACKOA9_03305 [Actinomycetota bacterium]